MFNKILKQNQLIKNYSNSNMHNKETNKK